MCKLMKCVQFEYEKKYVEDFLKLPKMLYTKLNKTENYKDIKNILLGKHMLLKYIDKLYKFVIYDDNGKIAGRFKGLYIRRKYAASTIL